MTKNFDRQRKMNTESGMILKVSFLVVVFLMIILTPWCRPEYETSQEVEGMAPDGG